MATTEIENKTQYGFGTAGHGNLQLQFATTLQDYDPAAVLALQQSVLDGIQADNPDVGALNMDFGDSPEIEKFVPNRGWPAGGTTNPQDITEGPPVKASGAGSQESPAESAAKISKHKIGEYIFGKSPQG